MGFGDGDTRPFRIRRLGIVTPGVSECRYRDQISRREQPWCHGQSSRYPRSCGRGSARLPPLSRGWLPRAATRRGHPFSVGHKGSLSDSHSVQLRVPWRLDFVDRLSGGRTDSVVNVPRGTSRRAVNTTTESSGLKVGGCLESPEAAEPPGPTLRSNSSSIGESVVGAADQPGRALA